jgi:hypothetical protein
MNSPFIPPYPHKFLPPLCYKNNVFLSISYFYCSCYMLCSFSYVNHFFNIPTKCTLYIKYIYLLPNTSCVFRRLLHHPSGRKSHYLFENCILFCNVVTWVVYLVCSMF